MWDRQSRAAEIVQDLPEHLERAGLTSHKLMPMTGANRRAMAREVGDSQPVNTQMMMMISIVDSQDLHSRGHFCVHDRFNCR